MLTNHEMAVLVQAVTEATFQALSPWATRATAALYAHCSKSEIDRGADEGYFRRYKRGDVPMFKKSELDAALIEGRWLSRARADLLKAA